ncbi:uncharacterized protein PV09_04955 [Verruconis gallopava]|uniref:G-patch domain-containing protein n=1 Tax=Verruconis gallopava TaxID=253628 RepID=A0A0D1YU04_9PEZI|nr:uncharacterized protein PV09_04955 [Verruconis gallopava]KIW04147.1 hypothetical protein PV09_04955 [Verruconis gallopava]
MAPARERSVQNDDEDDYMSMVIEDVQSRSKETSIQRAARLKREGEARSRQKTKEERERDERLAREAALASSLDASNKGFKIMTKLGYKPGSTLGKTADARTEPIHLSMKEDRGGIGMDSEKKRKIREALETNERLEKKAKTDQVDYRERLQQEREEKRLEHQAHAAQRVAERLDTEAEEEQAGAENSKLPFEKRPLKSINVLWRGLVKARREREAQEHMKREVQKSLTYRRPDYNDSDEDEDDSRAFSTKKTATEFFEQDLEDEDEELDEFDALAPAERLARLVAYLRSKHLYCFWCKSKYPDADFLGCPGITEEAHEL